MLHLLKPQNINCPKVRLGPSTPGEGEQFNGDGGYVTPTVNIDKSVALVTYGVDRDIRYELDYNIKYNKPAYLFDHTVEHPREPAPGLLFTKEGLGRDKPDCSEFLQHYNRLGLKGDVLLKIDIEGGEYDYFIETDLPGISLVTTGLLLEVHWLDIESNQKKFITIMEKLKEFFVLTHVHGNNWGGTFNYVKKISETKFTDIVVPKVLELTFTNKRFVNYITPDNQTYPIPGLDLRNCAIPGRNDYSLDFLNDY